LHKVRNGFLGHEDWPRLTTGAGLLTQAPIWIDDSAAATVLELRAKCRRLKSEGKLGLVVIDYLQLVRSTGSVENRVQEISQITRALKALAKELDVPVDRKSTRLNSSHVEISYAVFCLKKKK